MGVTIHIARMRARLRRYTVTPTTYNNQLIEKMNNEPVLGAPTRWRRTHGTFIQRSIGKRNGVPTCAFSSGVKIPRLDLGVWVNSPQACLLTATILEEGTTVERGPSDFGCNELV